MQPNIELMDRIMSHIRLFPESHDQGSFGTITDCGTSFCFGGWAVALEYGDDALVWEDAGWLAGVMVNGKRCDIVERANALLRVDGWADLDHTFSNSSTVNYGCDCGCGDYDDEIEIVTPSLYSEVNTVSDLQERVDYYRSLSTL